MNNYVTLKEYAAHRHICETTMFKWLKIKEFPSIKQGRRRVINVEAADRFVDAGGIERYSKSRTYRKPVADMLHSAKVSG